MGSETSEINCSYGARRLWDTKVAKISVRRYLPRPHPTSQIPLSSITGLYSSIKTASQSILFGSVRRPLTFAAFVGYEPPAAALITPPLFLSVFTIIDLPNLRVVDAYHMSERRADMHPVVYVPKGARTPRSTEDCLHWCIPGPPDWWNALTLQYIHEWRSARHNSSALFKSLL